MSGLRRCSRHVRGACALRGGPLRRDTGSPSLGEHFRAADDSVVSKLLGDGFGDGLLRVGWGCAAPQADLVWLADGGGDVDLHDAVADRL